jgi:diguanylate cyclase (GGDEF)-like protein
MGKDPKADIANKLAQLRLSFRGKAEGELDQLSEFASRVTGGDQGQRLLREDVMSAYQLLHRLAGSAGTFGYTALGAEARRLEQCLKPLMEKFPEYADNSPVVPGVENQGVIDTLAQAGHLRSLLDEALVPVTHSTNDPERLNNSDRLRASDIHVVLCGLSEGSQVFLEYALSNYGFSISRQEVAALSLSGTPGVTLVVTDEDSLSEVSAALDTKLGNASSLKPPLVCIGRTDDFRSRYSLADAGADALFTEPVDATMLAEGIERLVSEQSRTASGKILILDDDEDLAGHYRTVLEGAGFSVRAISNPETVLSELSEFCPDIMLLDVCMGAYSGPTVAKLVRFDPEWVSLPIIYLSSEQDKQVQLEAMAKGADEFLTKPVSDTYLVRAAQVRCYRARQLNELLIRDSLTGLLKHSFIKQEVDREHVRCRRRSHSSVVAMLDLDHFKKVNDQHGHRMGDIVIKALASLLRRRLRATDIIGRYGGEEFAVVLPECTTQEGQSVMAQICDTFSGLSFSNDGTSLSVTLSVGIAALNEFEDGSDALNAADQALYERKKAGRNGVTIFQQG